MNSVVNNISLVDNSIINNNNETIIKIPFTIDENNVFDGTREILKVVRPSWQNDDIKFKLFTDGKTNILIGCYQQPQSTATIIHNNHPFFIRDNADDENDGEYDQLNDDEPKDLLLIRIYGNQTDLLIDRDQERRNIQFLQYHGFASRLHATFENGLIYDYIPGVTVNADMLSQPSVWKLVARHMARMHRIQDTNGCFSKDCTSNTEMWKYFQKFLDLIPAQFSDEKIQERVKQQFLPIQRIENQIFELRQQLEILDSPIVFCHNDLLLGNIVYNKTQNQVTFIDFEYAFFNYQAFDIGNHFAEHAGMENIDYTRYPGKEFQYNWLREYLEEYESCDMITDDVVHKLYVKVNKFALASHLFWALWGLIQAEYSTIDYDFVVFAETRYNEYLAKKEIFLSLN